VGASVLALFVLGEVPRRAEIAGGVLILSGIFLVLSLSPQSAREREPTASGG
jgi:drug/metabolite transporter (DMT)-like permease